jgi:hypothetical protein
MIRNLTEISFIIYYGRNFNPPVKNIHTTATSDRRRTTRNTHTQPQHCGSTQTTADTTANTARLISV